jgi:hypothetical protein
VKVSRQPQGLLIDFALKQATSGVEVGYMETMGKETVVLGRDSEIVQITELTQLVRDASVSAHFQCDTTVVAYQMPDGGWVAFEAPPEAAQQGSSAFPFTPQAFPGCKVSNGSPAERRSLELA